MARLLACTWRSRACAVCVLLARVSKYLASASCAAIKSLRVTGERLFLKAVIEGYRNGKRAKWLSAEDYETLLTEPLEAARKRLNIAEPVAYKRAQARLREQNLAGI